MNNLRAIQRQHSVTARSPQSQPKVNAINYLEVSLKASTVNPDQPKVLASYPYQLGYVSLSVCLCVLYRAACASLPLCLRPCCHQLDSHVWGAQSLARPDSISVRGPAALVLYILTTGASQSHTHSAASPMPASSPVTIGVMSVSSF